MSEQPVPLETTPSFAVSYLLCLPLPKWNPIRGKLSSASFVRASSARVNWAEKILRNHPSAALHFPTRDTSYTTPHTYTHAHHARPQPLFLDLNQAPVPQVGSKYARGGGPPTPQSSCPHAPQKPLLLSLPPGPTQRASIASPAPSPHGYPMCSQSLGKCNLGSLAAALHLICIMFP